MEAGRNSRCFKDYFVEQRDGKQCSHLQCFDVEKKHLGKEGGENSTSFWQCSAQMDRFGPGSPVRSGTVLTCGAWGWRTRWSPAPRVGFVGSVWQPERNQPLLGDVSALLPAPARCRCPWRALPTRCPSRPEPGSISVHPKHRCSPAGPLHLLGAQQVFGEQGCGGGVAGHPRLSCGAAPSLAGD